MTKQEDTVDSYLLRSSKVEHGKVMQRLFSLILALPGPEPRRRAPNRPNRNSEENDCESILIMNLYCRVLQDLF
jgi:hypothetical protein